MFTEFELFLVPFVTKSKAADSGWRENTVKVSPIKARVPTYVHAKTWILASEK